MCFTLIDFLLDAKRKKKNDFTKEIALEQEQIWEAKFTVLHKSELVHMF